MVVCSTGVSSGSSSDSDSNLGLILGITIPAAAVLLFAGYRLSRSGAGVYARV